MLNRSSLLSWILSPMANRGTVLPIGLEKRNRISNPESNTQLASVYTSVQYAAHNKPTSVISPS